MNAKQALKNIIGESIFSIFTLKIYINYISNTNAHDPEILSSDTFI